jgi:hypothetical protein
LRPAFGQLDLRGNLVPPRALDELLLSLRLANQASESKSPEDIRAADELPLFGRSPELATATTKLEFVDDDGHDDWVEAASAVKEFFVDINKEKNDFDFDAQASQNFKDDGMPNAKMEQMRTEVLKDANAQNAQAVQDAREPTRRIASSKGSQGTWTVRPPAAEEVIKQLEEQLNASRNDAAHYMSRCSCLEKALDKALHENKVLEDKVRQLKAARDGR